MYCTRCGAELGANSAFCNGCGVPTGVGLDPAAVVKRPALITLLAVLQFVAAVIFIPLGLLAALTDSNSPDTPAGLGVFIGGIWLVLGIVSLACGVGLWKLRPYGRVLQLGLAAIGLLAIPIGTVISGLIIYYLIQPGIRALFSGKPASELSPAELAEIATVTRSSSAVTIVVVLLVLIGGVMVVGIIAAIAVPGLLRARMAGNEASAIGSMRTIVSAQMAYAASAGSGGYATQLATLARACPGMPLAYITPDLANDPSVKSGYTIALQSAGAPSGPVDCNAVLTETDFYASAQPVTYNTTGARAFSTSAAGAVYVSDGGIAPPVGATLDGTATPLR